jgi:hypothetical protein
MRKHSTYRPKRISPPMLVSRGMICEELELRERMIVEAFSGGWAGPEHFDNVVDMRNVLTIGGAHKDDRQILSFCHAMSTLVHNIRTRHTETGRMGVSGEEKKMLLEFCGIYRDFWLRQSVSFYERCCDELDRVRPGIPQKEQNNVSRT